MQKSCIFIWIIITLLLIGCAETDEGILSKISEPISEPLCEQNGCWNDSYHVCRDKHLINLFTRKNGWTGGDATYSVALPNNKVLWMFGDSFIDQVNENGSRPSFSLINNCMVLQEKDQLSTLHSGTSSNPQAFARPLEQNWWYWPADATVAQDTLYQFMHAFGNDTGGAWDFYRTAVDLLTLNPQTMEKYNTRRIFENPEISFGAALLEDDDHTYVYGVKSEDLNKYAYVARTNASLDHPWEYYAGSNWSTDIEQAVTIFNDVSEQFSVFKNDGAYYLLTQHHIFGSEIYLYSADSPMGPWGNRKIIYCTPETGDNIFTYNALVHPHISGDSLTISYNVNSFEISDLLKDINNYRPYFIRVGNWKN